MEITVFGSLADITGGTALNPGSVTNTNQLKKRLLRLFPSLSDVPYVISVNNRIIQDNMPLQQEDTIALMPPFSGG
jgi:sulfur-carrier protein